MIDVKHYDGKGKLICTRSFKSVSELTAFYRNKKNPDLPERPSDGCWNCMNYDPSKDVCTKRWNNLDPCYYNPDLDDKDPFDYCDDHVLDEDADYDDFDLGGNEP